MSPRSRGNEWGVDDEDLFRFVLEHTGPEPTFTVIMSTSYHPPFSIDVEKKGFDLNTLKANPISAGLSHRQMRILGHLWYSDKCVSDFVGEGERKLERSLFVITGDHYSRKQFVSARLGQPPSLVRCDGGMSDSLHRNALRRPNPCLTFSIPLA